MSNIAAVFECVRNSTMVHEIASQRQQSSTNAQPGEQRRPRSIKDDLGPESSNARPF
jgi:hypothetical protein